MRPRSYYIYMRGRAATAFPQADFRKRHSATPEMMVQNYVITAVDAAKNTLRGCDVFITKLLRRVHFACKSMILCPKA